MLAAVMEEIRLHQFAEKLELRGYSPKSVEQYCYIVGLFFEYLESREDVHSIAEITRQHLNAWHAHVHYAEAQKKRHLATGTIYQRIGVIKTFFEIMHEEGLIEQEFASMIHPPKQKTALPQHVPTVEEMKTLLDSVQPAGPLGTRDRAMLELLYASAVRSDELLSAEVSDIDIAQRTFYVRGKGSRVRIVPVGSWVIRYLLEYLEQSRPALMRRGETPLLFLSRRGRKIAHSNLCRIIADYCTKAALSRKLKPHSFRHACATHMLHNGADIRYIQELLGHTSLSTTQIYTRVDIKDLKRAHHKYHPREQDADGA